MLPLTSPRARALAAVVVLSASLLAVANAPVPAARAKARTRARKPAAVHTIVIDFAEFKPARLDVKPGDKVMWINKDLLVHTATSPGKFDSGQLQTGMSWTTTFKTRGEFQYSCTLHPTMKGTVRVQ